LGAVRRHNLGTGDIDGPAVNVRGERLHIEGLFQRRQALLEQDGEGKEVVAAGAGKTFFVNDGIIDLK